MKQKQKLYSNTYCFYENYKLEISFQLIILKINGFLYFVFLIQFKRFGLICFFLKYLNRTANETKA